MDISSLTAVSGGNLPGDIGSQLRAAQTPEQQRKVVAGQFEAIMLRQMLSDSVSAMMGGDDTPAGSVYGYFVTDTFAQKLAQGGGMGLSGMIERQLTPAGQGDST